MHRKLNLKQRIGLCFAAFFAALAAQIVLGFYQSNTVLRQLDEQMGNFNAISRFQNGVERSLSAMEDYRWEYGDGEALLTELQGSFSVMNAWLWRIDGDLHTVSQEQYLIYRAVSTTYEHYNALVGQLETALQAGGDTEAAQLYYNKVAPCGGYLRQYTQQLLNTAITDGQEEYTAVSALSDRVKWLQTVVGVLCLALGSLMALEVTRMLNPVQRMIEASRKVTEGRYDAPDLPVPRQDEMGRLAEDAADEDSPAAMVMAQVRRYLEDNYMFDLSLDSVGEILHISPAYLSAQFKKYQKMNFLDCLTELRINAAKELLADPLRSTAEVASMVGYDDSSYFARAFKKRTGMTPTQYRRQAGRGAGAPGRLTEGRL